jgi:indolepyruvate ferredoxin oxidoreductase, beta subunit
MSQPKLPADPYNIIITGVGGQGNVLASRVLGQMLNRQGFRITIGETFGASQRGGSVMSHLRISADSAWSPQIPAGQAHWVIALEPSEAFRVLAAYGNPETQLIYNTRPIQPVDVIAGLTSYPKEQEIREGLAELSARNWPLEATAKALELGNPIFGNIMMIGALAEAGPLPLDRDSFGEVVAQSLGEKKVEINLKAYDIGASEIKRLNNGGQQ